MLLCNTFKYIAINAIYLNVLQLYNKIYQEVSVSTGGVSPYSFYTYI